MSSRCPVPSMLLCGMIKRHFYISSWLILAMQRFPFSNKGSTIHARCYEICPSVLYNLRQLQWNPSGMIKVNSLNLTFDT